MPCVADELPFRRTLKRNCPLVSHVDVSREPVISRKKKLANQRAQGGPSIRFHAGGQRQHKKSFAAIRVRFLAFLG
jgi:hypothetical protein